MKTLEEIDKEIADTEAAWRKCINETKIGYWALCEALYEEKEQIEASLRDSNGRQRMD